MSGAPPNFEVGPIRPPNEAESLLVRVSRNCPWNRCAFCPVYKGRRFELRSADEVVADIEAMAQVAASDYPEPQIARFLNRGGKTAFLQDANALITPVADLERILRTLREHFPSLERVTTYARSHTLTKRSVDDLVRLREAGLDRVHVGLESGSDRVLDLVDKGATAGRHIEAGHRAKAAGLELSLYVMPGLGGRELSEDHAVETARVLSVIDPHFIRLRTLIIAPGTEMETLRDEGRFEPMSDVEVAQELRVLLGGLEGIESTFRSDHTLNLLQDIDGKLPGDLPKLLAIVDAFLALSSDEQELFVVGRRLGMMRSLPHLQESRRRVPALNALRTLRERYPGPLDEAIRQIMQTFV
ncbi:MAG: radical SAM protein [Deltaproteobacteria bacterium]|nr:radical SAM protein [Deltaproteobacteria bacterium]